MSTARLARLVRLRETQHRIAAASVARAQAGVAGIDAVASRIADLRASLGASKGPVCAHDLHGYAELSARLDAAQSGLTRSRVEADRECDSREADRRIAHRAEDGAIRLHDQAVSRAAADAERRADAMSPRLKVRGAARW